MATEIPLGEDTGQELTLADWVGPVVVSGREPDVISGRESDPRRETDVLRGLVERYRRKSASANARADQLARELAEEQRKNQVLRSARSVALYQLQRCVRDLEVFDDRFMGTVNTSTGTVKSEPPEGDA